MCLMFLRCNQHGPDWAECNSVHSTWVYKTPPPVLCTSVRSLPQWPVAHTTVYKEGVGLFPVRSGVAR